MSKWLISLIVVGIIGALVIVGGDLAPRHARLVEEAATQATEPQPLIPADLDDADLDTFLTWAFRQGGSASNRFGGFKYASLTYEAHQESAVLFENILARLRSYDLSEYSASDQLSAQLHMFELETRIEHCELIDHEYLINSFVVNYVDIAMDLATYTHTIWDEAGIADYFERIGVLETRFDELIERTRRSEAIGATPTRSDILACIPPLRELAATPPTQQEIYVHFAEAIGELEGMTPESEQRYLDECEQLLANSILPAITRVADHYESLAVRALEDGGVWRHENGDEYYQHMLRYYVTTLLSPEEIHQLGLREVERLRGEIFQVAASIGLAETESIPALFDEITDDAGVLTSEEALTYCEELVSDMRGRLVDAFNQLPERQLTLELGEGIGAYSPTSGIYTVPSANDKPRHELASVTYHETIPGHHLQKSLVQEMDLPMYRRWKLYNAYAEGWALYAERLAWELGAYENDPYGNLGRLQYELLRAVRLVVDTGLHTKQWSSEKALDYMWENTGLDKQQLRDEIARYLVAPAQAVSYLVGMHTILSARDRAMEALGDAFSLGDFHECILSSGEIPLPFIDDFVDAYIEETLASS